MRRGRPEAYKTSGKLLLLLSVSFCFLSSTDSAAAQDKINPIPCSQVLTMGLKAFMTHYGGEKLGADLDAMYYRFAECHEGQNDLQARRQSKTTARRVRTLRAVLKEWDEACMPPSLTYAGGLLEEGHYRASAAVEREALLEEMIPLLVRRTTAPDHVARKRERARFKIWLKTDARQAARPPSEELEGLDAEARLSLLKRYQGGYRSLLEIAMRFERSADALPAAASARLYRYAALSG